MSKDVPPWGLKQEKEIAPTVALYVDENGEGKLAFSPDFWPFLSVEQQHRVIQDWIHDLIEVKCVMTADRICTDAGLDFSKVMTDMMLRRDLEKEFNEDAGRELDDTGTRH